MFRNFTIILQMMYFRYVHKDILFYLKDDYISKLRRLLTIEQYGNKEIGETFRYVFIDRILETQRQVLQKFIDSGRFIQGDAYTMALHFYSPIFCYYTSMIIALKARNRPLRH